jgi:hypothetical protein
MNLLAKTLTKFFREWRQGLLTAKKNTEKELQDNNE